MMLKHALYDICLRILISGLVIIVIAGLSSVIVSGGVFEIVSIAIAVPLFVLPLLLIYIVLGLFTSNRKIPYIVYFAGLALLILLFLGAGFRFDNEGGDELARLLLYLVLFSGIAAFITDCNIVNSGLIVKRASLEREDKIEKIFAANLENRGALNLIVKMYAFAALAVLIASTGPGFMDEKFNADCVFYGLIFSLCLIPAFFLSVFSQLLGYRRLICDMLFIATIIVFELCILLFVLNVPGENNEGLYLASFGFSVIAFGAVMGYLIQIYLKNVMILNQYSPEDE